MGVGKGRPNLHCDHTLREKRPEREVLMPHGLEGWPARRAEPFEVVDRSRLFSAQNSGRV